MEPLAQRLRPRTLDEVCGQQHLLGKKSGLSPHGRKRQNPQYDLLRPIRRWQKPPLPASLRRAAVCSCTSSTVPRPQPAILSPCWQTSAHWGQRAAFCCIWMRSSIFNKRQQQSLLECVEQGTVTLIASTTENPYFYVYNALLSRCTVFEFKSLTADDIRAGLRSAAARLGAEDQSPVFIPEDALDYLAQSAGGDMRKAIGNLEFAVTAAPHRKRLPHHHA